MLKSVGERFSELRNRSGLTQSQIADYLNVDQSYISKYEKNERQFSVDILEKAAALFGCPIEYFTDETSEYEPMHIAFRAKSVTVEDLETIAAINKIALNLRYMEGLLEGERMKENIELNAEAISLRKQFGEDAGSPIEIFSLLQNNEDLTTVFYPMSDRISGMCIRDGNNKIIGVNSTSTYGRQRYTIAHELYHLFFQEDFNSIICPMDLETDKDPGKRSEYVCLLFSSTL